MNDGRYIVEYYTENDLGQGHYLRVGEFQVQHDWLIDVQGHELEEDLKLGPIDAETEDKLERGYNNGYYSVRELPPSENIDPEAWKRVGNPWSAN